MRSLCGLFTLLAWFVLAGSAQGGPNYGGAVIVHVDEDVVYTSENAGYCGQSGLEDCSEADVRVDGTDVVVFHAIAAFPGRPRLAGVVFGIDYDPAEIVLVDWGMCGGFELPDNAWPDPGAGTAITWPEAQTAPATEIYWFAAYSYNGNPSEFRITAHPVRGFEPLFGDDAVPANIDDAVDVGSLGFNMDGYLPCAPDLSGDLVLSPSNITAYASCGGTFPIDLIAANVEDLGGFSACVGFDAAQLTLESAVIDPAFLGSTGRTVIPSAPVTCNPFYEPDGIRLQATTSGTPDGPSGSGRVGRLFFSLPGNAAGVGSLGLDAWTLQDTNTPPEPIYVAAVPGVEIAYSPYCFGDYNGDGDVTAFDLAQVFQRWPKCEGDPGYDVRFDANLLEEGNFCASTADGCIDVVDAQTAAGRWHLGCADGFVRTDAPASAGDRRPPVSTLRISPAFGVVTADLGDTLSVALVIDGASDLGAFETEITFDPNVLNLTDVDFGNLLGATGRTGYPLAPQIDNEAGVVRFGSCTVGSVAGASESGVLARIVFEVVECGVTTDVAIANATITNTAGWVQEIGGTTDGSIEINCAPSSTPTAPGVRDLTLSIRPNPASSTSEIGFSVPASAGDAVTTRLDLFDASGRLVRTLLHESLSSGPHSVVWDTRDSDGRALPGGTFFCRLQIGDETVQRQVVLTR